MYARRAPCPSSVRSKMPTGAGLSSMTTPARRGLTSARRRNPTNGSRCVPCASSRPLARA